MQLALNPHATFRKDAPPAAARDPVIITKLSRLFRVKLCENEHISE